MKKIILIYVMSLLVTGAYAQGLNITDDNLDKLVLAVNMKGPEMATTEMKLELNLNKEQFAKVARINQERYESIKNAEVKFASNPDALAGELRTITIQSDKALINVLTDKQMLILLDLERRQDARYFTEIGEK